MTEERKKEILNEKKPLYRKIFRVFKRIAYFTISILRIFTLIKEIFIRKGD